MNYCERKAIIIARNLQGITIYCFLIIVLCCKIADLFLKRWKKNAILLFATQSANLTFGGLS